MLGEMTIVKPQRDNHHFFKMSVLFLINNNLCIYMYMYSIYLSRSGLLIFIILITSASTNSIWIRCNNEVINNVDCVIKHDGYPQIFIYILKISAV